MVAVTTARAGKVNGMILDSAIRASISPVFPRLSVYIHKWHLTHEYLWETGVFTAHLLHRGQLELVHRLGFASGRDRDKLGGLATGWARAAPRCWRTATRPSSAGW